jgi:putative chitinase
VAARAACAIDAAIAAIAETVFNKYGIETPLERAHFMAQISHECGAGTIVREDMNYSAERIVEIFGYDKAKSAGCIRRG